MKIQLEKVLEYEQPQKYIVATENYSDEYTTPVLTAGKSFILGYTDETDGIYKGTESPVIIFDDFTSDTKYVDFDFKVKSSAMKILHKVNEEDFLKYFFYAMQKIQYKPFSHKRLWISEYSKFEIEKRTPEEQKIVVNDLDNINNAISLAKQRLLALDELVKSRFIEMFENKGFFTLLWNDVFITKTGKLDSNAMVDGGEYPFFTCAKEIFQIDKYAFDQEALLLAGNNAVGKYDVKYYKGNFNAYQRTYVLSLLNNDWSYRCFQYQLQDKLDYLQSQSKGSNTKYLTLKILAELDFVIPPISLQNEFAEFVKLIDKSKFIVQQQIKDLEELLDSKMDEYFR